MEVSGSQNGGTVPYKGIFSRDIPLHRPYIGPIYGRYLQFRFLLHGHWLLGESTSSNVCWNSNVWCIDVTTKMFGESTFSNIFMFCEIPMVRMFDAQIHWSYESIYVHLSTYPLKSPEQKHSFRRHLSRLLRSHKYHSCHITDVEEIDEVEEEEVRVYCVLRMLGWKKVWFNHDNIWTYIYIYMKIQHEKKWWWNFEARRMVIEWWKSMFRLRKLDLMIKHWLGFMARKSWMSPAKTIPKGWKHMQAQNICDKCQTWDRSKDHDVSDGFRCSRKTPSDDRSHGKWTIYRWFTWVYRS